MYVYIILKKVKWVFKGKQIKWIGFGFAQHLGGGLASQNSRGLVWIHLQAQHTSPSSQLAPGSVNVSAYLCHSQRWFGVLLRGLESNAMRRRGMTANGGWRGSGGREVSKSGSRAATRRGTLRRTRGRRKVSKSGIRAAARGSTLRRTNASRGERQAKVWRCWCTGDRGWHMERFCHAAHHCYVTVGMFAQCGLGSVKQWHWVVCSEFWVWSTKSKGDLDSFWWQVVNLQRNKSS